MRKRAEVKIYGMVQGVAFRYAAMERAEELNLTGWVRNTRDHAVEAVFEGEESGVQEMVRWCHAGPPSARVTKVDVQYSDATGEFSGFNIVS